KEGSDFTAALAEKEKIVQAEPNFGPPWCVLGLIDAALSRKEEALREGRHAVELLPVEKDAQPRVVLRAALLLCGSERHRLDPARTMADRNLVQPGRFSPARRAPQ